MEAILTEVELTGRELGRGAYGSVEAVRVVRNGESVVCAAKRLHHELLRAGNEGVRRIAENFRRECRLMSDLRHPNVAQFIGLWYDSNSGSMLPLLVMELLETSLDERLNDNSHLPLSDKLSILKDVACGLAYLHGRRPRPVIHRDLTARNVLLNLHPSLVAKISDVGNSRILDTGAGHDIFTATLSSIPGTLVYMPPEAMDSDGSRYGPPLDIFSFGHLALYAILQEFPGCLLAPTYVTSANGSIQPRSEVERRKNYITRMDERIGVESPLARLVRQCLENDPHLRPKAENLLSMLQVEGVERQQANAVIHGTRPLHQHQRVKLPLQLTWRRGPDMPFEMDLYVQAVVLQGNIYVGGGLHEPNHSNNCIVMVYNISTRQWSQLRKYEANGFAMVVIKNQLTLVGGSGPSRIRSLGVLENETRQWTHPYPDMSVPRTRCSAVAYREWLVVAGGLSNGKSSLTSVEVLSTNDMTWHRLPPLPTGFVDMKTAVVDDVCYFMGGCIDGSTHSSGLSATDKVFSVSLSALVSQIPSQGSSMVERHGGVWKETRGFIRSTPLSLGGSLLALGGRINRNGTSSIYCYQVDSDSWESVGQLQISRFNAACVLIEDRNELVVVGGCDSAKLKSMDIASIN